MFCFYDLNKIISKYLPAQERLKIVQAFIFGADAHETQVRSSGEPYFTHPVAVACILAEVKMDVDTIIAALLHDVVEDTEHTHEEIQKLFGTKVSELVEGVTKLTQIRHKNLAEQQAENFRKMLLSVTKDVRVIFIKLADRLHNMRTLAPLKPEKKRRISQETLDVFAPIAHRLGINTLKEQLETLAFQGMYPYRYHILDEKVKKVEKNKEKVFYQVKETLIDKLGDLVSKDSIKARKKTLYSIYNKMRKKGVSFEEIMDMYAYKVIVPSRIDCYIALGKIHELYKPIPQRFKDYIATPKANGYRSIHTVVLGPYNIPLEIQIKTEQMDRQAEYGIAAHWSYKIGEKTDKAIQRWLKKISDINVYTASSVEFLENVKTDMFNNDVFVFTPQGEIVELPQNSTCIDFAYYIHTDVGNKCIAARVNRKIVPLNYRLKQGDNIEIVTSAVADPNPVWLDFVETGRAKSAIKDFLKQQYKNINYISGKELVEGKLQKHDINIKSIPNEIIHGALFNYEGIETVNRFYLDTGLGLIDPSNFIEFIVKYIDDLQHAYSKPSTSKAQIRYGDDQRIAECCLPLPGDEIKAIVTEDGNIEIHRGSCNELYTMLKRQGIKQIQAGWSVNNDDNPSFRARIAVTLKNIPGAVAKLTTTLAREGVDIRSLDMMSIDNKQAKLSAIVVVRNRRELYLLLRLTRKLDVTINVERILNK
ncbi:bifunctional (p)ppGpp synthetase/guanosine-3',5'-bis(diphosphate) 3'-pyrophosphohydrolase [Allofrancisella guangzhouensis]|uniref:guanosine-3',5'-bis(diphosphate) 3'-diphosphatase n=1 Tax=Allofrancisella guangzhouensis TaxID=594679 RepID=A0A0A8E5L4_9GAMM|nr:bifunctional (p)ppGpp synthetase/guanosine-3',5'-bis(diphosphate) 3'-pyrophosphohydrolase [Allofrancisella guangzhouensis]AJC49298.1 GDP diphosphokinase [Allofrancisella guangzhouensis]MBK2027197.1 bifunctional (p)ppGpp synthetase/guanosine-3',5'-bis(diphosphate) 3'-pyrophosphohydrolase [Allofrancisella guangzhouensis]MBK2044633.1 bifunctional (p)ppGpp synthetase/guanosine-3',5'-bis(diphosphate) 3'-pyrophosphohydrolase [Allofrancisella guangzhouensis]MBK2045084.1 bifunctional (p)ppGpp synthe